MAFTAKYLQRLNVDELKELLSDDEAELSDAEKERITGVIGEKEKDDDPDDALIDRIADRVVGKLTAAEEIVDAVTRDSGDDDDGDKDKDKDKSKNKSGGGDDDADKDKDKSKDNGKKDAPKPSLAARFHGR